MFLPSVRPSLGGFFAGEITTFIPPLYDDFAPDTQTRTTSVNLNVPSAECIAWFPAPRSGKLAIQVRATPAISRPGELASLGSIRHQSISNPSQRFPQPT
jgi:hypothetical protein